MNSTTTDSFSKISLQCLVQSRTLPQRPSFKVPVTANLAWSMKWPILCSLCPSISGIPRRPKVLSILVSSAGLLILPIVGAYPHPDAQVVGLLTENFSSPIQTPEDRLELQAQELTIRYYMFFKHLFDTVPEQSDLLHGTYPLQPSITYFPPAPNNSHTL